MMTFEEAWARKEEQGYRYGPDALENIRFGWEIHSSIDHGIEMVREFNSAYRHAVQTRSTPGIPTVGKAGRARLAWWASQLEEMAAAMKAEARELNAAGSTNLGLLLIRLQLSVEETGELAEALSIGDVVKAFDALLDMSYVNDGHYHTLGLADLKLEGYREVHNCNMSKLGPGGEPLVDGSGRVVKGPNTRRPEAELFRLVNEATFNEPD